MLVRFKHVYSGLRHETDLPAVPRQGEKVRVDGRRCTVVQVTWVVESGEETVVKVLLEDD